MPQPLRALYAHATDLDVVLRTHRASHNLSQPQLCFQWFQRCSEKANLSAFNCGAAGGCNSAGRALAQHRQSPAFNH